MFIKNNYNFYNKLIIAINILPLTHKFLNQLNDSNIVIVHKLKKQTKSHEFKIKL